MGLVRNVVDWESAASHLLPRFLDADRRRVATALRVFELILGNDWGGWRDGFPLSYLLHGSMLAGRPLDAVRLAGDVVAAYRMDRFEALRRAARLGEGKLSSLDGAAFEFRVWHTLHRRRLRPRFIAELHERRTPDLIANLAGRDVAIELKALQASKEEDDLVSVIKRKLELEAALAGDGDVQIDFAPAFASDVLKRIDEIEQVAQWLVTSRQSHAVVEGLCTVRTSRNRRSPSAVFGTAPASDRGSGPANWRDVRAVRRQINESAAKFIGYRPALLMLRGHQDLAFRWRAIPGAAGESAAAISEVLGQFPIVSGVVLVDSEVLGGQTSWADHGDNWLAWALVDRRADLRSGMLVKNPKASHPLSEAELRTAVTVATAL